MKALEPTVPRRDPVDRVMQGWVNRKKSIRSAVRLKYSLMADEELKARIPAEQRYYFKRAQEGVLLAPIHIDAMLDE